MRVFRPSQIPSNSAPISALVYGGIVCLLPGPVEGGIGPRQEPTSLEMGMSWLGHHTVSSPFVRRTCTIISRDSPSRFHQYQPGCVGEVVVRGRRACDLLSLDAGVMLARLGRPKQRVGPITQLSP